MIKYKVDQLLQRKQHGVVGPMSPVEAAKTMARNLGVKVNGLCRVWFTCTPGIHQKNEGSKSVPSLTGHDTLVIASHYPNVSMYFMFVDMGVNYLPVGMYDSRDVGVILTPIYKDQEGFEQMLTEEEVTHILKDIHENGLSKLSGSKSESVVTIK